MKRTTLIIDIALSALLLTPGCLALKKLRPLPDPGGDLRLVDHPTNFTGEAAIACTDGSLSVQLNGLGTAVLVQAVTVVLLFYGPWSYHDTAYVRNFVQHLDSSPWFVSSSDSVFRKDGVYSAGRLLLGSSYLLDPLDFPDFGYELSLNQPGFAGISYEMKNKNMGSCNNVYLLFNPSLPIF